MATGTVKSVTDKGYGFIKTSESRDKDIFYHESVLTGELSSRKLRVGDEVEFDIVQGPKGMNAANISLLDRNGSQDSQSDSMQDESEDQE